MPPNNINITKCQAFTQHCKNNHLNNENKSDYLHTELLFLDQNSTVVSVMVGITSMPIYTLNNVKEITLMTGWLTVTP
jgi:hypothetical protein